MKPIKKEENIVLPKKRKNRKYCTRNHGNLPEGAE